MNYAACVRMAAGFRRWSLADLRACAMSSVVATPSRNACHSSTFSSARRRLRFAIPRRFWFPRNCHVEPCAIRATRASAYSVPVLHGPPVAASAASTARRPRPKQVPVADTASHPGTGISNGAPGLGTSKKAAVLASVDYRYLMIVRRSAAVPERLLHGAAPCSDHRSAPPSRGRSRFLRHQPSTIEDSCKPESFSTRPCRRYTSTVRLATFPAI